MTVWFFPWTASSHRRVSAVVWTTEDAAVAAAYRVDARRWSELFGELMDTIEARFTRPEARRRVRDFVAGLLAPLPVKNCWTIAEHAGDDGPGGMQDLIGRGSWDDAAVRADVRELVTARLGHPEGILVVDETGDLKKGVHTVGVQRQVLRHRREDRELSAGRPSVLRLTARAHPARRRALPAEILVRGPRTTR